MNWLDVAFLKISVLFFAFFIASWILDFVETNRWLWLVLFVIFGIKPFYTAWIKKTDEVVVVPRQIVSKKKTKKKK